MTQWLRHKIGYAMLAATVLTYFSRPWSCGFALSRFATDDPVPYALYDQHGWIVMVGWMMALLFAPPILWLAWKIYVHDRVRIRLFGRAPTRFTISSILIAMAIGAPTHSQMSYLFVLPTSISMAVIISSVSWLLIVEVARTAVVEDGVLNHNTARIAILLGMLIGVPKLFLLGVAFV